MTTSVADEALSAEAPTGELVLNRYRPICRLGRGGQADVFLAMTPGPADFHRLVVIKVLRDASGRRVGDVASFLAEARLAARLNHPNVIQTFEVAEYRSQPCIVMEHLEGQSLDRVRHAAHSMSQPPVDALWARIMTDALAGLTYAHELADFDRRPLNIVHRDISPQNIFVTYHGQVKVLDFGIAQANAPRAETEEGVIKGKANYLAPEQARDRNVDARADLFSFGVVFWELLTGVRLIKGDGAQAIYHLLHEPLPRVRDKRPDVDPQLDDIVARALEKDPERRYQSAAAMRQALEAYMESLPNAPRADDVAQLVQNRFEAQRDAVRRKIREFIAQGANTEPVTGSHQWGAESARIPVLSTSLAPLQTGTLPQGGGISKFWPLAALGVAALAGGAYWLASISAYDSNSATADIAGAASVTVESEPAGARVHVDGSQIGVTPVSLPLPTADTEIKLTAPGYEDALALLSPGDATSQLIVLAPATTASASASATAEAERPPARRATRRAAPSRRTARRPSTQGTPGRAGEPPATPEPAAPKVKVIDEEGPKVQIID